MGAKTCMLAYGDADIGNSLRAKPVLDREASRRLVESLFPRNRITADKERCLGEAYARGSEVYAGDYQKFGFISAREFAPDRPSNLRSHYLEKLSRSEFIYLHAMHSVVDWFAYAVWKDGVLIRSLSVSPDSGVIEDLGERREFEKPFWDGLNSVDADDDEGAGNYPLQFHPLELGEAALLDLFGFQLEGSDGGVDPFAIPVCSFRRSTSWWKLW